MPFLILGLLLLGAVIGPGLWVGYVLRKEGRDRPDLPGTGGELARHLLDEAGLQAVGVEQTDKGDHYDPATRTVRLLPQHRDGRSVAAVAVAAHEVSHAVQHARDEPAFRRRIALVEAVAPLDVVARVVLISAPFLLLLTRAPSLLVLQLAVGLMLLAVRLAVHAVTLPVEFDASFGKALPVLERGGYLAQQDLPAVRRVLRAAALTYVASALTTLVNILRWIRP